MKEQIKWCVYDDDMNMDNLKLTIDQESVNIYIDNGEDKEPTHICYWHIEEWEDDSSVAISIFNAIELYYTNPKKLLTI